MAINPFKIPLGYEVIPNVAAMAGYTDIKKLDPNSPVLIGRKKPSTIAAQPPKAPTATAASTPSSIISQLAPKATPQVSIANTPSTRPANAIPINLPSTAAIPANATNFQPAKKLATLYGPNNAKEVVEVGSFRASRLQSQGWGLAPNSYRSPTPAQPVKAQQPANNIPFNIDTGKFQYSKPAVNPFTQPITYPKQTPPAPAAPLPSAAVKSSTPAALKKPTTTRIGPTPFPGADIISGT